MFSLGAIKDASCEFELDLKGLVRKEGRDKSDQAEGGSHQGF